MYKTLIAITFILLCFSANAQQKIIQLQGGESEPTLAVVPVDPMIQTTGTSVIICSGKALYAQDSLFAKWLGKKGITTFLLKPTTAAAISATDIRSAINYVRAHAEDYHLRPNQICLLALPGANQGAISAVYDFATKERPDFAGLIEPRFPKNLSPSAKHNAPPIFIAALSDSKNTLLYNDWIKAGQSIELHLYATDNSFRDLQKQDSTAGSWTRCFAGWMGREGLLKPLSNEEMPAKKKAEAFANLQKYYDNLLHNDWAWLSKYSSANAQVPAPAAGENRVVFLGNSITENWQNIDSSFFKNNHYIGRGIGGQVSAQMLVRFREDVINLQPKVVVIEAGTNDIAENRGPISLKNIFGNIVSMIELARANNITPIISSVLPATDFPWHHGLNPAPKIIKLNAMLKAYAQSHHIIYVDYWSAMVNDKDGINAKWSLDGFVHPNLKGYKVMEPLVQAAIHKALNEK